MFKICTKCLVEKSLDCFNRQSANKDGLTYYCKECNKSYQRKRYEDPKYKDYQRNVSLKASYGITLEEYYMMLDEQGGVCAICKRQERRRHPRTDDPMLLAVDHDHSTGQIRGLLCQTCNMLLGHAQDDVVILATAIQYISKWEGGSPIE